ncbi:sulfatase-like hydrolase/transferase [Saccharicrinis sp. GN24d3]|uniref:sulfatase-like hydrolase/transferase n=1 Tax=Saccharicrinis sp. GN24d3 TaxID=3458416 RepID=UPI004035E4F7
MVLLIDDAGYADFGFAGCKDLKTPNIDKLASNGVVFTDAHVSASVCGPSRAGIMTGRYQQRFGFECNPPRDFTGVSLNETTLGEAMKQAGYKTAAFGKWHLGDLPEYRPNARGFDYFWGFLAGGRSYFSNDKDDTEGETHSIRENDTFATFEGYLTDRLGDKAVEFIDNNKDKPFFMYWAPNAVHTPMEATKEDLALFKDHPRQTLAAMTWALDRAVGSMVSKLEDEGLLDNTLIFFLSDNGGAHNNQSSNKPLKGFKGNKFEGGHRVPFFIHWPDKIASGMYDGLTSALDVFATSISVAGEKVNTQSPLDGVNLIPYLKGKSKEEPHNKLFWRKDKMAAVRKGDYKLIRVEDLGERVYNLKADLQENNDLSSQNPEQYKSLMNNLECWEEELDSPLWTEGQIWDTITWMIHEDLFLNREVRVKNPGQLNRFIKASSSN